MVAAGVSTPPPLSQQLARRMPKNRRWTVQRPQAKHPVSLVSRYTLSEGQARPRTGLNPRGNYQ